ncbi:hypothetical protein C7C46_00270 [Streptomyces tateyamensis]|uniref:PH domain-containing protein n=1 Tax=Streptomyces tateyamensis TaxID=565073 RepID=A0A2V4NR80_9ACTN|nr:hypothetical protein [Streptomyces tateyamensis]PYC88478.1 hypothetical protein C7C46_00270 [Streptomyces tateyamensis]
MDPLTIRYSRRRRAVMTGYTAFCWLLSALFFVLASAAPEVGSVLRSGGAALAFWSLLVLWLTFASVRVDAAGITQRWPGGLRSRIPWSNVTDVAVVHRTGFKGRRQIKVTLTAGRSQPLLAPVDRLRKPVNPAFDQEAAAVLAAWESARAAA